MGYYVDIFIRKFWNYLKLLIYISWNECKKKFDLIDGKGELVIL